MLCWFCLCWLWLLFYLWLDVVMLFFLVIYVGRCLCFCKISFFLLLCWYEWWLCFCCCSWDSLIYCSEILDSCLVFYWGKIYWFICVMFGKFCWKLDWFDVLDFFLELWLFFDINWYLCLENVVWLFGSCDCVMCLLRREFLLFSCVVDWVFVSWSCWIFLMELLGYCWNLFLWYMKNSWLCGCDFFVCCLDVWMWSVIFCLIVVVFVFCLFDLLCKVWGLRSWVWEIKDERGL